jgi:serine protease Do
MSDPSSADSQRFEPLPDRRHYRSASFDGGSRLGADPATPERWFDPSVQPQPESSGNPPPPSGRGYGSQLVAVLLAAALIGAIVGGGGSYLILRVSGALDAATAAPAALAASAVSVESDQSTVISAVKQVGPAVVQISAGQSTGPALVGSGIIYDQRGWILTNKHVVDGATDLVVRLQDGREAKGTTYGLDTLTDLAIVKIDGLSGLSVAPLGVSASLRVGELAIAIGSPIGLDYAGSVTTGIISALGRDLAVSGGSASSATSSLHELIQTDAAINAGNSGGPLVDAAGRVVGIATAQADVAQGIGFAIPIDIAKPIMQQALAGEKLSRPFIGVTYDLIDRGLQDQYHLPLAQGAWVHAEDAGGNSVAAVLAGSPGDVAGIKTGDIITQVEGQAIDSLHPLQDVLVQYAPGRTVSVQVYRNGSYVTIRVTLGTRPDSTA